MIRLLLFFSGIGLLLINSLSLSAQDLFHFEPSPDSGQVNKQLVQAWETRYQEDLDMIPKKYSRDIREKYTERKDNLLDKLSNRSFLFGEPLEPYLDHILQEIFAANPEIPAAEVRLLISRRAWANAASHGEGTIVLNIGLLNRLENESQLAFVICHELAHFTLDHSNQAIHDYVATWNSKEVRKERNEIRRSTYQTYTRAEALMKDLLFDARKHSRWKESEADSLGMIYLQRTRYQARAALSLLGVLDRVDEEKFADPIDLKQSFHFQAYPFQEEWIAKASGLAAFGQVDYEDEDVLDSLKTHPACIERIRALVPSLESYEDEGKDLFRQEEDDFERLVQQCDFEIVEGHYRAGNLSACLYASLKTLPDYPKHPYLSLRVGQCLLGIYEAQVDHQYGYVVDRPNRARPENYNDLIRFLGKLRTQDLASLGYYFLQSHWSELAEEEEYLLTQIQLTYYLELGDENKRLHQLYQQTFPTGKKRELLSSFRL